MARQRALASATGQPRCPRQRGRQSAVVPRLPLQRLSCIRSFTRPSGRGCVRDCERASPLSSGAAEQRLVGSQLCPERADAKHNGLEGRYARKTRFSHLSSCAPGAGTLDLDAGNSRGVWQSTALSAPALSALAFREVLMCTVVMSRSGADVTRACSGAAPAIGPGIEECVAADATPGRCRNGTAAKL